MLREWRRKKARRNASLYPEDYPENYPENASDYPENPINHVDGVKANYPKFGKALAKVTGQA